MNNFISAGNMAAVLRDVDAAARAGPPQLAHAVQADEPPVRQVVYNAMVDIARDPVYAEMAVDELNALTVEIATDFYARIAEQRGSAAALDVQRLPEHATEPSTEHNTEYGAERGGISSIANLEFPSEAAPAAPARAPPSGSVIRCLSIDSHDRDVHLRPDRYAFTCDFAEPVRGVISARTRAVVLPTVQHTVNSSHLLLVIAEFPSAYSHNASDVVRRAFSKLIPRSQYASDGGRVYTVLEPIADDHRVFAPPLPALSRLSVSLLRPDGEPVCRARDDFTVRAVELGSGDGGPGGAATYTLTLNTAFATHEFREQDAVVVRGCATGNAAFDDYMNRAGGHVVLSVVGEEPASAIGRTTVVIRHAGAMGQHGLWEPAPGADDVFPPGDGRLDLTGSRVAILNLSVQISITLEVECAHAAPDAGAGALPGAL